jgi:ribonuclease HI
MPKITDFPGFEVSSVKRTIHSGNGVREREEGFNPFARDNIVFVPKEKEKEKIIPIEDILGDARTRPAVALRQASMVQEVKDVTSSLSSIEEKPFVSLFPPSIVADPSPSAAVPSPSPSPSPAAVAVALPMIQPRSKEGQRLLYKHPMCPRVGPKGAYWMLVGQSDRSAEAWLMQFDGGANPNPGPASAGAVLWTPMGIDGKRSVAFEAGKFLGKATNNIGEVQGLLLGLQVAATRGARELLIEGDSELIVFQQTGQYRVSNANLKRWWAEIQAAMMDETCFDWIAIRQVPREQNERADAITKDVLVKKANFTRA